MLNDISSHKNGPKNHVLQDILNHIDKSGEKLTSETVHKHSKMLEYEKQISLEDKESAKIRNAYACPLCQLISNS